MLKAKTKYTTKVHSKKLYGSLRNNFNFPIAIPPYLNIDFFVQTSLTLYKR